MTRDDGRTGSNSVDRAPFVKKIISGSNFIVRTCHQGLPSLSSARLESGSKSRLQPSGQACGRRCFALRSPSLLGHSLHIWEHHETSVLSNRVWGQGRLAQNVCRSRKSHPSLAPEHTIHYHDLKVMSFAMRKLLCEENSVPWPEMTA